LIPTIGFALIPLVVGILSIGSFNTYAASMPVDEYVCGNAILGPLAVIAIGTPLFAISGAVVGFGSSRIAKVATRLNQFIWTMN